MSSPWQKRTCPVAQLTVNAEGVWCSPGAIDGFVDIYSQRGKGKGTVVAPNVLEELPGPRIYA